MIQNTDRRFLTLPAVRPCEGISPETLLRALVVLARDIRGYRSAPFPVHRHVVREAIREVGILLEFLEVVGDHGCALPASAVLSLSELHVTFQKMRHLVRDCGRRGARLWVLMRSDRVSCEFRILIRSIATALDVLPLASICAPVEIEELVKLVAAQAWRVTIGTDPADEQAAGEVLEILTQFEKGIASPDPSRLQRVLNHLEIRSWTECTEEISFLEEEIGAVAESNGQEGEIALLGSLRGFMIYSRSVMFEVVDSERINRLDDKIEGDRVLNHLNVEDFRCPISLELMTDPVTVSTGQTYDRASIVRWLKAGNLTCPVTGEKLVTTELLPNSTLRKFVRLFCSDNNVSIDEPSNHRSHHSGMTLLPGSSAAAEATRMLAAFLAGKLKNGTEEQRSKAVYEIRLLAKSSIFERACLAESGSVPWLLDLLLSSSDPSAQQNAMAAVLNLSKHPKGRKAIFESGGLSPILDVLRKGLKIEAQQNAAATLFYLSSVDEYRKVIGEMPEAIPALAALLTNGNTRGKKNAVVALFGLLLFPGNHRKVLAAGTVPNLISILSSDREDLVSDALAVLAALAEGPEGTNAILQSPAAVPLLVNILRSPTSQAGKEHCISVLLHLCNNGGTRVAHLLDGFPSLMPSLYLVHAEGSPRAGKKANSLINIIHRYAEAGISAAPTAPVQQEHVAPVQ